MGKYTAAEVFRKQHWLSALCQSLQDTDGPEHAPCRADRSREKTPVLVKESTWEQVGNDFSKDVPDRAAQGFGVFWDLQAFGMAVSQEGLTEAVGDVIRSGTRANLGGPCLLCPEIWVFSWIQIGTIEAFYIWKWWARTFFLERSLWRLCGEWIRRGQLVVI